MEYNVLRSNRPSEVQDLALKMLGHRLVTKQTPPDGVPVNKLMVAEALDITKEAYFAIVLDRESNGPVLIASPQGGVDIEAVAEETPDLIFKEKIDISKGPYMAQCESLASKLGLRKENVRQVDFFLSVGCS